MYLNGRNRTQRRSILELRIDYITDIPVNLRRVVYSEIVLQQVLFCGSPYNLGDDDEDCPILMLPAMVPEHLKEVDRILKGLGHNPSDCWGEGFGEDG